MMQKRWEDIDDADLRHLEAEMADHLRDLRLAGTVLAERVRRRDGLVPAAVTRRPTLLSWGLSAVTALLLVAGGIHLVGHKLSGSAGTTPSATAGVQQPASDALSDEALLEQVQTDLDHRVPTAMQPLASNEIRSSQSPDMQRSE